MKQKLTEWHISDYIKTDEDVHNLLAAEREPYEKALRQALAMLQTLERYPEEEKINYYGGLNDLCNMSKDMATLAKRCRKRIMADLKAEGIPDPTELKDKK